MDNSSDDDQHYNPMRTAQDDIRPDFVGSAKGEDEKDNSAAGSLGANEAAASKALPKKDDVKDSENTPSWRSSVGGKPLGGPLAPSMMGKFNSFSKLKINKVSALSFVVLGILVMVIAVYFVVSPPIKLGTLHNNIEESANFDNTDALLEKVASTVSEEDLKNGRFPKKFFHELAKNGIDIGQVTANGDFVRTNTYIANIDELDDIAAVYEDYNLNGENGELSVRFENEIIKGSEFVATIESNPRMYAAYSDALNIGTLYWYSDGVEKVYKGFGVPRDPFAGWEYTGNEEQDKSTYDEILKDILDKEVTADMAGCGDGCESTNASSKDADPFLIIDNVSGEAGGTAQGSQLLNSAFAATESYRGVASFVSIMAQIERAMLEGEGPTNLVMNTLSETSTIEYVDAFSGETVDKTASILGTTNFAVMASLGDDYSYSDAASFSFDKANIVAKTDAGDIIKGTTAAIEGGTEFGTALKKGGSEVDDDVMSKLVSGASISISESNYDLSPSIVGAHRIMSGALYLRNMIDAKNIFAVGSDESTVNAYYQFTGKILARKAEAERATKSPFDISSKHTFLGSIVHGLATASLRNSANSLRGSSLSSAVSSIASYTGDSLGGLFGKATAEDNKNTIATAGKDYCVTVKQAAGISSELLCGAHMVASADYTDCDSKCWEKKMKGLEDEFKEAIILSSDREVMPGIKSATVCEAYRNLHSDEEGFIEKIFNGIKDLLGVYHACNNIDEAISTDAKFTASSNNAYRNKVNLFSGYATFDKVKSLLHGEKSAVSKIREDYYAKYPKDESPAGKLARRSGLTKGEAQIAINYANYLTRIAKYDPSTRQAFGAPRIQIKKDILIENNNKIAETTYYFWREKIAYGDLRNRNFVV